MTEDQAQSIIAEISELTVVRTIYSRHPLRVEAVFSPRTGGVTPVEYRATNLVTGKT